MPEDQYCELDQVHLHLGSQLAGATKLPSLQTHAFALVLLIACKSLTSSGCTSGSPMAATALIEKGDSLRADICRQMLRRRLDLEPFVGPVDDYVQRMARPGEWGGTPCFYQWPTWL